MRANPRIASRCGGASRMRAIARARSDVRARSRGERSGVDFAIVARRRRRRGAIGDGVDGANAMAAMAPPRDGFHRSQS
jgi:hypothetical protein